MLGPRANVFVLAGMKSVDLTPIAFREGTKLQVEHSFEN